METSQEKVKLHPALSALRVLAYGAIFLLMLFFLHSGTTESRILYLLSFLISAINPVWGLYGLALMAPMFLRDPGSLHLLAGLEIFVLGIFTAELRLLGHSIEGVDASARSNPQFSLGPNHPKVFWGLWPYLLVGLVVILLASSLVGIQLILFREQPYPLTQSDWINRLFTFFDRTFYGSGTEPEWAFKSLWNWTTGALLAVVAARRANPLVVARWLKLAGISLFAASALSLLDWMQWLPLTHIRPINPDPLHVGRLQGTAGHAGWYAEWIVIAWPGLLLWWSHGRLKRNLGLSAAIALVGLCLILTAARASWLGAFVAGVAGCLYIAWTFPHTRRFLPHAGAIILLTLIAGFFLGGDIIQERVAHLLRAQDRANYYITGWFFLSEHPFGLGLGTHYQFYEWTFTPFYRWAQLDHVTSHSLWLHTLIENGPAIPSLLFAIIAAGALELKKSWHLFEPHTRTILFALFLALVGIFTVGIAQYIFYLRIVEIATWIACGFLIGMCRKKRCRMESDNPVDSHWGPRVLLVCGALALMTASLNAHRIYTGQMPRLLGHDKEGNLTFWTGSQWRTPVNRDIDGISFSLYRTALPVWGTITWPDGSMEPFHLQPEETKAFTYSQEAGDANWLAEPQWLVIKAQPLFTPADNLPDNTDNRGLGVYITSMKFTSAKREKEEGWVRRY
jgi:O-Antigen ligase